MTTLYTTKFLPDDCLTADKLKCISQHVISRNMRHLGSKNIPLPLNMMIIIIIKDLFMICLMQLINAFKATNTRGG